ncbi:MAG: universal stress protein [Planctomycetes bacterium]|nr:universal stress protein [Planctomycetota bacterium]MCB9891913.1 universal stress protein [Planctomycetota bacterium]
MFRRIVVGLDGSEYSKAAVRLVCDRAKTLGAVVIGVGIIDRPAIESRGTSGGIGASGYVKDAREKALADARQHVKTFLAEFQQACQAAAVVCEVHEEEGEPHACLLKHARAADLLVVGQKTYFHFETEEGPGDTLDKLLREPVCPVLAIPKNAGLPEQALIAYDGSASSVQAMHAFAMAFGDNGSGTVRATVLHVGHESPELTGEFEEIAKYLEAHGIACRTVVVSANDPAQGILGEADSLKPVIIVLGSSRKSGLARWIFGSTVQRLLEVELHPVFLFN